MKKRNEITLGIFLVIVGIICLSCLGNTQVYQVPNYSGGLNLLDDSTNIAPNEALVMTNLVLDMPNVMSSRKGFSVLNSTAIDTTKDIRAIYIYEPYQDTVRMMIVSNGYVYKIMNLSDPGSVDWDTLRLSFTDDSLKVIGGSVNIQRPSPTWWYSKVFSGDKISMVGDASNTEYVIYHVYKGNDTTIVLLTTYSGATADTTTFTIYLRMPTTAAIIPSLTQSGDKLFIANESYYTVVYNDTSYVFMALIDSGMVTDTTQLTGEFKYNQGKAHLDYGSNWVIGDSSVNWGQDNVLVSYYFTYITDLYGPHGRVHIEWTAIIDSVDTTGSSHTIRLTEIYPKAEPPTYWNNYEITTALANCVVDSGYAIEDTNKNWMDSDYGKGYLQDFYAVNNGNGYSQGTNPDASNIRRIYCNETNTFSIPWQNAMFYDTTDYYYIFAGIPYSLDGIDSTYKEFPRFDQVFFYNDQLYGFGWDRNGYDVVRSLNYNRIWYSAIGESRDLGTMHRYIKPFYNIDIDLSENASRMFKLRGRAYIASDNSIWSFTGIPGFGDGGGDLYLEKVISNNGIPDIDNWAKATEEYGYFANYDGIFRFNGIRAKNISYDIDRAVKQYSGSECVLVYQSDRLYVSYPDSGVTFIYKEPLEEWYGPLNFGMTCAYAPVDTDIIYFGNPDYPGYVFFYPNGLDYDVAPDDDTLAIAWVYESGWQSLTEGPWNSKRLLTGYFPANLSDTFNVDIFADFNATPADTFTWYPSGSPAHRFDNLSAVADYFKIKIYGQTKQGVTIRPYRIEYQEADMREGN